MIDEPQKPKRRRRWLVALVVLVIAVAGWWNWPCGDARFVGKWRCHRTCPSLEVSIWTLSPNGTGFVTLQDGKRQAFGWRVSHNQFEVGSGFPEWMTTIVQSLPKPLVRVLGSSFQFTGGSYEVVTVSAEECVLKMAAPAYCVVMLRRLPD